MKCSTAVMMDDLEVCVIQKYNVKLKIMYIEVGDSGHLRIRCQMGLNMQEIL
jgi:hypothetical protein